MLILTNDDGIEAPGLAALVHAIAQTGFADRGVVVAPQTEWSGCGHQVTTHRPIQVERRSPRTYAISGTPADCVRIALNQFLPQADDDPVPSHTTPWVISGINAGGNMGADVYISGTVAAVREAAFHRVPGIAISQYRSGKKPVNWARTQRLAETVLTQLLSQPPQPGAFWNVNLPYLDDHAPDPSVVICQPCTRPLPIAYRYEGDSLVYVGEYSKRDRTPGTDVDVCFSGQIAVTQIQL